MDHQEARVERIDACRELYLKHEGRHHELIEKEMRALGHKDFHRRIMHDRFERGRYTAGWINQYGFDSLVRERKKKALNVDRLAAGLMRADSTDGTVQPLSEHSVETAGTDHDGSAYNAPIGGGETIPMPDFPEFLEWLKKVSPSMTWEWKHQVYIYKRLRRVSDGLCKRLMIFLPPRHGKSELVTVRYAAWRLKQDPKLNIILSSYNQRLANRFSRKVRRVLTEDQAISDESAAAAEITRDAVEVYRNPAVGPSVLCPFSAKREAPRQTAASGSAFPFTHRRANSEAEWETSHGGGMRAVGVGSGVTGFGAGLIIIDDPIKSRAEAESQTYRDNIWDWFNDDLYTRLEPNGAIILIQTRWHEDDLAGRLLREAREEGCEQWEVVDLPALAEPPASAGGQNVDDSQGNRSPAHAGGSDPLGRPPGAALCPERFNVEALERLKRKLGSYSFAALYQQKPVPAEGGLFKRKWFNNVILTAPAGLRWARGYDLAMSMGVTSDYTASFRVAYDKEGNLYIDGGFRRRIEYPEQRKYVLGRIESEPETQHCVELSANGNAVIQDLRRDTRVLGRILRGVKVEGSKVSRALPWIALAEAGKLYLVRGAWNIEFIDEACSFPAGTHDDQIDAVSIAVRMCRQQVGQLFRF
ncbi:MAG: phage terminase large subunit [Pyrinomonadaceae bacterium]